MTFNSAWVKIARLFFSVLFHLQRLIFQSALYLSASFVDIDALPVIMAVEIVRYRSEGISDECERYEALRNK